MTPSDLLEKMELGYKWRKARQAETLEQRRARYDAMKHGQRVEVGDLFLGDIVYYGTLDKVFMVVNPVDSIGNSATIRCPRDGYITGPGRSMFMIFYEHGKQFEEVSEPVHFTKLDEQGRPWEFTGYQYEPKAVIS
jgi:hypothetical protein